MSPDDRRRYAESLNWILGALHELPSGVLFGTNGASAAQCAEMIAGLDEFAQLSARLGIENSAFIGECRWHFEHYPHYLQRRRHFVDYATYISDRQGPMRVCLPEDADAGGEQ